MLGTRINPTSKHVAMSHIRIPEVIYTFRNPLKSTQTVRQLWYISVNIPPAQGFDVAHTKWYTSQFISVLMGSLVIKHCSHVKKIILTVRHQIFCQANLSDNNEVQYGLTDCQIKE